MTMSSFTSLTLSPTPLVTFNIAFPSRTLDAITTSRTFNIHIMAGDSVGSALADRFTRGNTAGSALFDGVKWKEASAPILTDDGVLCVLKCRLLEDAPSGGVVEVRDHAIIVGEVVEMIPGRDQGEGFGLVYADRRYREMGDAIAKHEE
jgi:flavin reductase (DIM6/NTAB) family NADH-FMN oxidoreductase RutF